MAGKVKLTVACGDYEIVRALKEGAVEADGLDLVMLTDMGPRERHWRMARKAEFDVCEANVGAYFASRTNGLPPIVGERFSGRAYPSRRQPRYSHNFCGGPGTRDPALRRMPRPGRS